MADRWNEGSYPGHESYGDGDNGRFNEPGRGYPSGGDSRYNQHGGRSGAGADYSRGMNDGDRSHGEGAFDQDRSGQSGYDQYRSGGPERDWADRAGDEVRSWFGDDDAERRRDIDQHRGKGPKNYSRSDDRIREDVCDRLSDDARTDASDIDVTVASGEVTLSGTVTDRQSKRSAEDCLDGVSGVQHVQNNLRVKLRQDESSGNTASLGDVGPPASAATT